MISDNIPRNWDMGLRFCKCRTLWIEYVYTTHVKKYDNDWRGKRERAKLKARACKLFTGRAKDDNGNKIHFAETINTHTMLLKDRERYDAWMNVIKWVQWFCKNMIYIENMIKGRTDSNECCARYVDTMYKMGDYKRALFIVKYLRSC